MNPTFSIEWPCRALPAVRLAGVFPLQERHFRHAYRTASHAIHLHDYFGAIRIAETEFPLVPGTLTLSPADQDSSYHLPRPGMHWCVHFDPAPPTDGPVIKLPLVLPLGDRAGDAAGRLARVARLYQLAQQPTAHPATAAAAEVALAELLTWVGLLDSMTGLTESTGQAAIERVIDYIDHNPNRPHSAADLAARFGMSQNYIARIFRRHTGMTVARYTLQRRIELARLLLRSTAMPIEQIAIRVGLPDAQHFNKQFRAVAGVSPSGYRKRG